MKTAIQIAIENIEQCLNKEDTKDMLINLLELEKEQIIEFANCFYDDCITEGGSLKQSAEDYYNQTYDQNK